MMKPLIRSLGLLLVLGVLACAQTRPQVGTATTALELRARQLEPSIIAAAKKYKLDARLLRVVCFMESRFRTEAVSPKGASGPMQFMPDTARRYGLRNPHDPQQAIDAAAHYLRDLLNKFGGRVDLALAAYNSGEGTVTSFLTGKPLMLPTGKIINPRGLVTGGVPPYPETLNYVRRGVSILQFNSRATESSFTRSARFRVMVKDFTLDAVATTEMIQAWSTCTPASSSTCSEPYVAFPLHGLRRLLHQAKISPSRKIPP